MDLDDDPLSVSTKGRPGGSRGAALGRRSYFSFSTESPSLNCMPLGKSTIE